MKTLRFLFVYVMTIVLLKRNCKMLMKWLRAVLEIVHVFMHSYIEAAEAENTERHARFRLLLTYWSACDACAIHSHRDTRRTCRIVILWLNIHRHSTILRFELTVLNYFWFIRPKFDKFRDKWIYSVFMTGFRNSVCISCITEIIGPYKLLYVLL